MSPQDLQYEKVSTATLEEWLKHPRSSEDAKRIREELQSRGAGRRDTGTMDLFAIAGSRTAKSETERPQAKIW